MRAVDLVHGYAAIVRHPPEPALAPGLADRNVHVVRIRHGAHRCHAPTVHQALLGGIESQNDIFAVATHDLRISTRRARYLAALADLDFDVVDDRADGNVADRHGIAGLHVDVLAGYHRIAGRKPLWCKNIGEFAVSVFDQRDEARAIWIVFDALDCCSDVEFLSFEIDLAV